jgi:NAD dependent epimerase/dehydratase family enzyme
LKIAITGGTAGIGQALGNEYETRGHEVLRLSRRKGQNIRIIPKTVDNLRTINNPKLTYNLPIIYGNKTL